MNALAATATKPFGVFVQEFDERLTALGEKVAKSNRPGFTLWFNRFDANLRKIALTSISDYMTAGKSMQDLDPEEFDFTLAHRETDSAEVFESLIARIENFERDYGVLQATYVKKP